MLIEGILALVAVFSLGGEANADWWAYRVDTLKVRVDEIVADEARATEAKKVLDAVVEITKENDALIDKTMKEYVAVASKKTSTPQDFEQAVLPWRASSHNIELAIVDARLELVKHVTKEEWEKLFPASEDVVQPPQ